MSPTGKARKPDAYLAAKVRSCEAALQRMQNLARLGCGPFVSLNTKDGFRTFAAEEARQERTNIENRHSQSHYSMFLFAVRKATRRPIFLMLCMILRTAPGGGIWEFPEICYDLKEMCYALKDVR
jgi:hypothetical protein